MQKIELPKIENYSGQPVRVVQVKLNGWYCEVYAGAEPVVWFKRHRENVFSKLPAPIRAAIGRLPAGTILRGELHAPGIAATSVPTLLAASDSRLRLTVFEVPSMACREFDPPRRLVQAAGLEFVEIVVAYSRPRELDEEEWCQKATERGIEGFVLKRYHGDDGYKLKPVKTVDAVVVGFTLSRSASLAGGLQSLSVAIEGRIIADVSNGLVGRRTAKPQALLGRVMEIKYQAVAARGRLQHPRFAGWREDKTAEMCTLSQLSA